MERIGETVSAEVLKAIGSGTRAVPRNDRPESRTPASRLVAEPCAQGVRLKRYERVAGLSELVLVSVEIVGT